MEDGDAVLVCPPPPAPEKENPETRILMPTLDLGGDPGSRWWEVETGGSPVQGDGWTWLCWGWWAQGEEQASESSPTKEQGSACTQRPTLVPAFGRLLPERELPGVSSPPQTLGNVSVRDTWNRVPGSPGRD